MLNTKDGKYNAGKNEEEEEHATLAVVG